MGGGVGETLVGNQGLTSSRTFMAAAFRSTGMMFAHPQLLTESMCISKAGSVFWVALISVNTLLRIPNIEWGLIKYLLKH